MKWKIIFAFAVFIFVSSYMWAEEESSMQNSLPAKTKEALITQNETDLKRQVNDLTRDFVTLSRRLDRMDDKIDRIDRDVKTLKSY